MESPIPRKSTVNRKRKRCQTLVKEMQDYLDKQQQELTNILSEGIQPQESSPVVDSSPDYLYPQRTTQSDGPLNGYPIKSIAVKVCIALVIPALILIVYMFGAVGGITGHPLPWFHTPKVYF